MSDNISDSVAAFRLRAIEHLGNPPSSDVTAMIYAADNHTHWSACYWHDGKQIRGDGPTPAAALENLRVALRTHRREEIVRQRVIAEMQEVAD